MATEPDKQGRLFNTERPTPRAPIAEPLCHDRDDLSSFEAAAAIDKSGTHRKHLWRVYFGVVKHPGLTGPELSRRLGFEDRFQCLRRLSDLKNMQLVCVGGRRVCEVRRRKCGTWYAAKSWPSRSKKSGAREPCERATGSANSGPGGSAAHGQPTGLSVEQRRRLREKLASDGNERTRAFLEGLKR